MEKWIPSRLLWKRGRPVEKPPENVTGTDGLAGRFSTGLSPFPQQPNRAGLHFPTGPAASHFIYKKHSLFLTQPDISLVKKSGHFHLLITAYWSLCIRLGSARLRLLAPVREISSSPIGPMRLWKTTNELRKGDEKWFGAVTAATNQSRTADVIDTACFARATTVFGCVRTATITAEIVEMPVTTAVMISPPRRSQSRGFN